MSSRRLEYLPLRAIVGASRNPKAHDLDALRASVDRFGFVEPIVLDERTERLVAGHGRLDTLLAAEAEGITPPDGVELSDAGEWMVPVIRGWASKSDAEAEALLVAVNELTARSGWEPSELVELLSDLFDADESLLAVTGFPRQELDDMLAHLGPPPDLDDLAGKHGDPDPSDFWPVLRFRVAPEVKQRYLRLVADQPGGDDDLFVFVVELAERAAAIDA